MIHRLSEKIKKGTKFFVGHGQNTNSHNQRESVGEILSSFVKDIGGKLSNIIIGHFPDSNKIKNADICSMEADIHTDGNNIVGDINEVTGIALGNSDVESPAFPGALRLNTIQCFGKQTSGEGAKEMAIEFGDVKKYIEERKVYPRQLFTEEDLKNDNQFSKLFENNSKLLADNERLKKDYEELTKKNTEAIKANEISKAGKTIDELIKEGYTDKQKQFIKGRFKPESLEKFDETSLKEYLENEKTVFAETAKLFGSNENISNENKNKDTNADLNNEEKTIEDEALEIMGV